MRWSPRRPTVLALLAAALATSCADAPPPDSAEAGARLFRLHGCPVCHGPQGAGDGVTRTDPPARDFRDRSAFRFGPDVASMIATIRQGAGTMPGYPHLSEAELTALARFIESLQASRLQVGEAWFRSVGGAQRNAAGYLEIDNSEGEDDRLLSAHCDEADRTELHRSVDEGGVVRMEALAALAIPSGQRVSLEPGGAHLMLLGIASSRPEAPPVGSTEPTPLEGSQADAEPLVCVLQFERIGPVTVSLIPRQEAP